MSTLVLACVFLVLIAGSAVLWGGLVWLGLRWAKVTGVTLRRVVVATITVAVAQLALQVALFWVSSTDAVPTRMLAILQLACAVLIPYFIVMLVFRASFLRSLQAWLPTLVAPLAVWPLTTFAIRPYIVEAFVINANSMAPTLLGKHWLGTCTQCGSPAFASPEPDYAWRVEPLMICRDNFHVMQPTDYSQRVLQADRVVVAKYMEPNRWDLVVFRYPEDPSTVYVMRLVGLPGEEITIKDGGVWADGKMLAVPDAIGGIVYDDEVEGRSSPLWGSPDRPAKLADDEYFVLGDFSPRSKDSRLWELGAPGHNPFAVPKSHLHGVVTHTYWPPERWRVFR